MHLESREDIINWFGFFDQGKWNENALENANILKEQLTKLLPEDKVPDVFAASYDLDSGKVKFL